jgi:hypothetical protein
LHQQEIIMSNPGHGLVGKREQDFTSLLPLRATSYNALDLAKLAEDMKGPVDTVKDGPDPEENVLPSTVPLRSTPMMLTTAAMCGHRDLIWIVSTAMAQMPSPSCMT